MATSGSSNYTQTRDQIILDAFQLLGVYGIGRTVSAEDNTFAASLLNKMIKSWGARGLHLWTKEEGILYLTPNVAHYSLGNASTDSKATLASDEVMTQLNGALATSSTAVTVDSTTGMTVGDYIGIVLTDKTIHWTTIATLPTSTTLTLTLATTGAASDNAYVYTFTSKIYKPLRILDARRRQGVDTGATSNILDIPMTSLAYQDYMQLPVKTSGSTPNQFMYNPKLTSGNLYLWPRPTDGSERIVFTFERIIEDLDSASDNFDFPGEWLETLTYQLALRLGPAFGKDQRTMQSILPLAQSLYEGLLNWDSEITEVKFMPDIGDSR